ncbi:hypothetical protein BD413DRAFT_42628 [Trametes elegans]|nr:hypothetical protein BD413DRAFT_42628 [Trametes elegans]
MCCVWTPFTGTSRIALTLAPVHLEAVPPCTGGHSFLTRSPVDITPTSNQPHTYTRKFQETSPRTRPSTGTVFASLIAVGLPIAVGSSAHVALHDSARPSTVNASLLPAALAWRCERYKFTELTGPCARLCSNSPPGLPPLVRGQSQLGRSTLVARTAQMPPRVEPPWPRARISSRAWQHRAVGVQPPRAAALPPCHTTAAPLSKTRHHGTARRV